MISQINKLEMLIFNKIISTTIPQIKFKIIKKQDEIISFLSYLENDNEIEIINLATHPDHTQKGYATKLLNEIKKTNNKIFLEVSIKNKIAQNLYFQNNFVKINRRRNYYSDQTDALNLMYYKKTAKAYAKFNYFLKVVSKRVDRYHNLMSLMDKINLYDEITIVTNHEFALIDNTEINMQDNIIVKAYELLKKKSNFSYPVKIILKKNIPIAAGMAGGSSDAAVVLKILNEMWQLNYSDNDLAQLSLEIGADVPFCIYSKPAIVSGIGEKIKLIDLKIPPTNILIINPKLPLLAKDVFNKYNFDQNVIINIDNLNFDSKEDFYQNLFNDLEPAAIKLMPEIGKIIELAKNYKPLKVMMSGSGPTVLVFDDNLIKLETIKKNMPEHYYLKILKNKKE